VTYLRINRGRLWRRPATGLEARAICSAACRNARAASSMVGHRATRGSFKSTYTCGGYSHRGPAICANRVGLPMPAADAAVLDQLRDYVLSPTIVEKRRPRCAGGATASAGRH